MPSASPPAPFAVSRPSCSLVSLPGLATDELLLASGDVVGPVEDDDEGWVGVVGVEVEVGIGVGIGEGEGEGHAIYDELTDPIGNQSTATG